MEHFEEWIEWILLNPEMAFKKEPELLEKINKELSLCKPFYKALLIQKIPDHFPKWRNDVDLQFGSKKKELLKDYIKIISIALKEENYSTEEEISAFKKVKNQLAEQLFYWKSMLGDRYKIDVFDNEDFKQNHLYQTIQREFKKVGYYSFVLDSDNVKIYTPELAYLFVNNDLEYFNLDSKVKEVVNRWEFLSMYIEGFKKGVNMFDMEYKIPTSVLYSSNSEQYINDLKFNYHTNKINNKYYGWSYVKHQFPFIFTHKIIEEFGYYSGIVNCVDELVNKYPNQFTDFYNKNEESIGNESKDLKEKILKHFGFFQEKCPRKHKIILNDSDFQNLIKWTVWYYENNLEVPKITEPIKAVNTNKTFVQLAFKYLFKELKIGNTYPKSLFNFYKEAFVPFKKDLRRNFEAVRNNDDVKKLMKLDY